jgi:hypothetical protein
VLPDVFSSMDLLGLGLYDLTKIYEERHTGKAAGSNRHESR